MTTNYTETIEEPPPLSSPLVLGSYSLTVVRNMFTIIMQHYTDFQSCMHVYCFSYAPFFDEYIKLFVHICLGSASFSAH